MIDTTRWVLVEAWLALGLRIRWAEHWETRDVSDADWMLDDDERLYYFYVGAREWIVKQPATNRSVYGYPQSDTPTFSATTLSHELAHYLVASEEARRERNFGLSATANREKDVAGEANALNAEQAIFAMARAAGRIASLALQRPVRP